MPTQLSKNSRTSRKKYEDLMLKTFIINSNGNPPSSCFLPICPFRRRRLYNDKSLTIPEYSKFKRKNMNAEDLRVVTNTWYIDFTYGKRRFYVKATPGTVFDGASVPNRFVRRKLRKLGQAIEEAALLHDILFAMQFLPFEDCNIIFKAMMKEMGLLSKTVIAFYMLGVNSFVGRRIFKSIDPTKHWMKETVSVYYSDNINVFPNKKVTV